MASTASNIYTHITKDPDVCGGRACIDDTRIRVMDIVELQREGYTPDKMLDVFAVPLTLAQVHAALAYYYDHTKEVDNAFVQQEEGEKESERKREAFLKKNNAS